MTTTTEPPRWHYRFANYRRAFFLLREALDERTSGHRNGG